MTAPPTFYYILAQTWPKALQFHNVYKHFHREEYCYWVLHGLWSNFWPITHNIPEFQHPTDKTCLENLNRFAPSLLKDHTNEEVYKEMYNKHGKPIIQHNMFNFQINGQILTPQDYLCKAAQLAADYNIGKYIRGVFCDNSYRTVYDITQKIESEIKHTPYIHCLQDADGVNYIDQIYLYFNTNFELISYPRYPNSNCGGGIYLSCGNNLNAIDPPEDSTSTACNATSGNDNAHTAHTAHTPHHQITSTASNATSSETSVHTAHQPIASASKPCNDTAYNIMDA